MNTIKTAAGVRAAFWQGFPNHVRHRGWKQNQYSTTIRTEWCDFIDMLARDGIISARLAQRVTL